MQYFLTTQRNTQELIKADKMIHVGVGDKNMAGFKNIFS